MATQKTKRITDPKKLGDLMGRVIGNTMEVAKKTKVKVSKDDKKYTGMMASKRARARSERPNNKHASKFTNMVKSFKSYSEMPNFVQNKLERGIVGRTKIASNEELLGLLGKGVSNPFALERNSAKEGTVNSYDPTNRIKKSAPKLKQNNYRGNAIQGRKGKGVPPRKQVKSAPTTKRKSSLSRFASKINEINKTSKKKIPFAGLISKVADIKTRSSKSAGGVKGGIKMSANTGINPSAKTIRVKKSGSVSKTAKRMKGMVDKLKAAQQKRNPNSKSTSKSRKTSYGKLMDRMKSKIATKKKITTKKTPNGKLKSRMIKVATKKLLTKKTATKKTSTKKVPRATLQNRILKSAVSKLTASKRKTSTKKKSYAGLISRMRKIASTKRTATKRRTSSRRRRF